MKTTPLGILAAALLGISAPLSHGAAKISVSFFYDALDPLGDWVQTDDYGYVWHPHDVDANWRPYTVGNWAYTDAGWTWVSEESFGWATYHYGRWANLDREGWVWVPDTEWAPAWVSWRDNDKYVGWAPLPPEARFETKVGFQGWVDSYYDIGPASYSFVAMRDLGAPRLREVLVEPRQNITIINETRNITKITYNQNVIVNEGPRFEAVSRFTAQPIRHLRLDRRTDFDPSDRGGRSERFAAQVSGDSLRVVAPEVEARRDAAPRKVAQRLQQVQVNRGWQNAGNAEQVQQARQKLAASEEKAPASLPARANLRGSRAGAPGTAEAAPEATTPGEAKPGRRPAPGSNIADTPGSRPPRATIPAPVPGREAATPEPGTPAPGTNPDKPGADRPGRKERTPKNSREPETAQPETHREGTAAQPGRGPNSPNRPSSAEPAGRKPRSNEGAEKADNNGEKNPAIHEGPGRRPGKVETPGADEPKEPRTPRERKTPGEEATPEKKAPATTPEEPKTRRPKADAEERPANAANEKPERPKAEPKKEDSGDEGAKRKTPPSPRTERSEPAGKPASPPAAEKRREGAPAERKEVPKGADKKEKDKNEG